MNFYDLNTSSSTVYTYSNVKTIRDSGFNNINPPSIKSSQQDFERDGIADRWNITMRIRKPKNTTVLRSLDLVMDFQYVTSDVIDMKMDSLAIVRVDIPIAETNQPRSIKTIGTLDFKQNYPVRYKRDVRTLYNDDLFSYLEYENYEQFLRRYRTSRNETTEYNYETYITRGTSDQNYIDIDVVINIPVY